MPTFNLDGSPLDTSPETPIPTPPPLRGVTPQEPRSFSLDGTVPGTVPDAGKIGLALEQDYTPESAAKVLKLGEKTRLPLPLIRENLDDVEREVAKADFDVEQFSRDNPKVAAWLAANPEHAALARDDRSNMSLLEQWTNLFSRKTQAAGHLLNLPIADVEMTAGMVRQAEGEYWQNILRSTDKAIVKTFAKFFIENPKVGGLVFSPEERASFHKEIDRLFPDPSFTPEALARIEQDPFFKSGKERAAFHLEQAQALQPKVESWSAQGIVGDVYESFLTSIMPMMAAGLFGKAAGFTRFGQTAVGTATFSGTVHAQALAEGVDQGMPLGMAQEYANWKILSEGIPESIPLSLALKPAAGFWSKLFGVSLAEGAQEGFTEMADIAYETNRMDKDIPLVEAIDRTFRAMAVGFGAGATMGGLGSIPDLVENRKKARQAKQQQQFFEAMGESATESKTRERLPEKYQELVEQLTKNGPVENLYVPVEFYQTHWANQNLDPRAVAMEMGIEKQYDEAMTTGGKLEIPTAIYARRLAPTEHNAAFARELSTGPDVMNAREADEFLKQAEQEQKEEAPTGFEESVGRVREDIRGQLTGLLPADVVDRYASLYEARIRSRAQRLGVDPFELYQQKPLTISRQVPEVLKKMGKMDDLDVILDRMRAGDIPTLQQARGDSLLQFIRKQGGLQDQGGELAARDLSKATPGLVRKTGLTLYAAAEKAMEAGYIKAHDLTEFMQALDEELQGKPRYRAEADDTVAQETLAQMEELDRFLGGLGVDLKTLDNAIVRRLLQGTERGTTGIELDLRRQEQGLFQEEKPQLSVLHNLSSENLEFADKMGGLAVPSLAIVKEGMGVEGYGDITLIGRRDLADPSKVDVYDADAYTSTFPRPEYKKVKVSTAQKFVDALRPFAERFDEMGVFNEAWDNAVNRPKPEDTISQFMRSNAVMAWFLNEKGEEINPVRKHAERRYRWADDQDFQKVFGEYFSDIWAEYSKYDRDEALMTLGNAARTAIDKYLKGDSREARAYGEIYTESNEARQVLASTWGIDGSWLTDGETMPLSLADKIADDIKKAGTMEINRPATRKKTAKAMKGHEADYQEWVTNKVMPMYGEPRLKRGGKLVPYTLDNIVAVMTSRQAVEETMTFGEGKARAAAAVHIKSFQEMRNRAEGQITERAEVDKVREEAKKAISEWREKVVDYYGDKTSRDFGRVWEGMDASMRAIAKWAKGRGLDAALRSEGFAKVPKHVIEQGIEAGRLFLNAPVPYFEAKPERAVRISEFAGAVIPEDASDTVKEILNKNNVPFQTYPKRFDETARTAVVNKFRNELQEKGEDVLFQRKDIKRGLIRLGADRINIELLKDANLSTFLHETGHLWLDELIEDATSPDAPQQLKDDLNAALEYMGVKAKAEDGAEAIRAAIKVEHHEIWARSAEAYLLEGKAPSSSLRRLFATFRAWLVSIYKSLKNLDVELTPEVRGVFDRLLATDEEIASARDEAQASPLFGSAVDAGMTDTEFEAYRKVVEQASTSAQEELEQQLIRDFLRARKQWWKDERAKIKTEVTAEVDTQRVYRAIAALQEKDGIKLDRKAIVDSRGKEFAKRLPRGVAVLEGGAHPDTVAEIVGYASGEELLLDLAAARPRNALIEAETDRRMHEDHGDLLTDAGLHDKARQAVQNEYRAQVIEAEIKALNRKAREVAPYVRAAQKAEAEQKRAGRAIYRALVPNLAQVREQAERLIAAKKVRDIRPMQYFAAARQASKAALEAYRKEDYLLAGHQKGMELLNLELYRQAIKSKEMIDTSLDKLKLAFRSDEKQAKTRNIDMVNAARAILSAHGIGRMDKSPLSYLDAMRRYDPEMYENMRDQVEAAVQDNTDYRDMTVDEFIGMRDSVLALMHTSRRSQQMVVDGKLIERKEIVEQLVSRIGEFGQKEKIAGYQRAMTKWEKTQAGLLGVRAILRRVESWVDAMDGGDPKGVFRRYVWNPVSDAVNRYREAKKNVLQQYLDLIKGVEKTLTHDKISAREINYTFSGKVELLHAILHTGNESNLSKLLRGRGWGDYRADGSLDTSKWDAFVARMIREGVLTKADYDFAQGVWDMLDGLKPAVQKAHHDMYGYYFDEVTAKPFENAFGQYRGGYAPAIVDPDVVADAAVKKDKEELLHGQNSFAFPTTGKGATMRRIERYARPLQLDMRTIPAHIDWALRFAYIEPAVKDVGRVLINHDLRTTLDNMDPAIVRHMLMPWLQRTANQAVSTPGMIPWLDKAAKYVRKNTGMQVMVANVINTLQQFTGFSIVLTKVKPHNLRNAFWQYLTHPKVMTEMVGEKSLFMRNRVFTQQADIQQTIDDMLLNPDLYDKARLFAEKHGYFMQQGTQSIVDKIGWIAAYNEAVQQNMDETDAVRHADSVVRETQGSFAPEDISRIEAGSPFLRLFLMFYNYFNMQANLLGTEFANIATNQLGLRKGAGRALYLYIFGFMIPAFIGDGLIRALIAGEPDDDDDGYLDDYIAMFFSTQGRTLTAMVPVAGPVIMTGINYWNDKWYDDRITLSPAVSMIESAARAPKSVYKAIADEGSNKTAIRDTLTAIGLVSGLPVAPLARPLGYLSDVGEGKAKQPENVIDLTRGLISGRDPNREK